VLLDPADMLSLEALDLNQIARDPLGGRSLDTEIAIQQSAADLVDQGENVVAEEGVRLPGQGEVVADVTAGLLVGHPGHGLTQCDPLVEGGQGAEFDPSPQCGLPDEQACEWGVAHVGVGEQAQFFEFEPDGEAAAGERDTDRVSPAGQPDQTVGADQPVDLDHGSRLRIAVGMGMGGGPASRLPSASRCRSCAVVNRDGTVLSRTPLTSRCTTVVSAHSVIDCPGPIRAEPNCCPQAVRFPEPGTVRAISTARVTGSPPLANTTTAAGPPARRAGAPPAHGRRYRGRYPRGRQPLVRSSGDEPVCRKRHVQGLLRPVGVVLGAECVGRTRRRP
jgi:hypothetical protein